MRTSFHHQPEAQHPNFPLSTSCRPITPSLTVGILTAKMAESGNDRASNPTIPTLALQY